jgi:prevent-host-death family protein
MRTPNWTIAGANAKFGEVIERAMTEGPQTISVGSRPAAVVVGVEDWPRKTKRAGTLAEFFARSPLRGSGLRLSRRRM